MPADAVPRPGHPAALGLALGGGPAAAALVIAAAAALGRGSLVAAVVVVQAIIAIAWLAVVGIPAAAGGAAIVMAAAIAADIFIARDDALTEVAGVVAASFVAALVMQLARRDRRRVTTSLAGVMSGVVLAVLTAYLLAIHAGDGGRSAAVLVALAVVAALLASRAIDLVVARLGPDRLLAARWPGLILGVATAAALGAYIGIRYEPLTTGAGILVGAAAALAAGLADIAVAVGSAELADGRRLLAVRVLALVLPLAAAAPAGYAVTTVAVS
jgi:hypothetical protein